MKTPPLWILPTIWSSRGGFRLSMGMALDLEREKSDWHRVPKSKHKTPCGGISVFLCPRKFINARGWLIRFKERFDMSRTKQSKQDGKNNTPGLTVVSEVGKPEKAHQDFRKAVNKRNDGSNEDDIARFLTACQRATQSGSSFSINEVLRECKGHELDPRRVVELFAKWISIQEKYGFVASIGEGCYDYPQWVKVAGK